MKLYGDLCGGLVFDFGLQRCCRNTRTTRNNTIRVKKRVHLLIIASNSCKVYTVADILKGVAQPRLDRKGRGQQPSREHAGSWGPWPPSWVGRSLGLHGSMVDNRSSRISKLLENAKATLPRISLPLWKGAIHENSKVDQLDLYRKPFPASNAIPFSVSIAQPDLEESFSASMLHGNVEEAKEVVPILPWLYRACGKMGVDAAEYLAAQLCINSLHILDYSKISQNREHGSKHEPPWLVFDDVAWVGSTAIPGPIASTAALLHRLAHRTAQQRCSMMVVILNYQPQQADDVGKALALYFHLYCGLPWRSSALAAGEALGIEPPLQSDLDAGIEEMAALGLGWLQRVILEWKYSGGFVEAAGDAVGGWDRAVPLTFNIRHRKWKIQLWGLPPGVYSYKFIVDGKWCIDVAAPSQTDIWGNANNVCAAIGCAGEDEVNEIVAASDGMAALSAFLPLRYPQEEERSTPPSLGVPSQAERLRLARFGASMLAYYTKSTAKSRRPLSSSVRR